MKDIPMSALKKIFSDDNLPTIDVTESIMQKISAKSENQGKATLKKVLIAIPMAVMLVSTTVFAVEQLLWSLKGPKGNTYNYSLVTGYDPKTTNMFRQEINSLEPGQMLFVFHRSSPDSAPRIVDTHYAQVKNISLEQITQRVGSQRFISPDVLPDGYSFREATIDIWKVSDSLIAQLEKECENEQEEYFCRIMDMEPNSEVWGYSLVYQHADSQETGAEDIRVSVCYDWSLDEINERFYDQYAEKIMINDFEAVLTQWDWRSQIKWLVKDNDLSTYISVEAYKVGDNFSPNLIENLKQVAESIGK